MDRIDPNSNQNGLNPQPDSSPPIRRASSRIARNSPQSAHPRPYPQNSNYHHVQTWLAQNRQAERQRNYYANYYSTSRNRVHSHRNSQGQTTTAPTSSTSFSSSEAARTTPFERITEIIRINNAATQTSSNTANIDEPIVSSNTLNNTAINSNPFLLTPLHDYIRTIGAFITYGTTGRTPTLVLNASGSDNNNSTNNGNANNLNIDIEPINFDTFFGFPDNYFNDGLTKQEINRHTISYEYKPALPAKRKRVKTEEINASTPSTSSATSVNENCSICLDKFNQNVQVRRLPCLHVFHIKCIDKWLKRNKKCPICRISITINYDTLMSSLESGSSIDQCLSQQESSMRAQFRPTITLSLQSNRGNSEITVSGNIVHSSMDLNSETAASNVNAAGTN